MTLTQPIKNKVHSVIVMGFILINVKQVIATNNCFMLFISFSSLHTQVFFPVRLTPQIFLPVTAEDFSLTIFGIGLNLG